MTFLLSFVIYGEKYNSEGTSSLCNAKNVLKSLTWISLLSKWLSSKWKISPHAPSRFWFHHIQHGFQGYWAHLHQASMTGDSKEDLSLEIYKCHGLNWYIAHLPTFHFLIHLAKPNCKGGRKTQSRNIEKRVKLTWTDNHSLK